MISTIVPNDFDTEWWEIGRFISNSIIESFIRGISQSSSYMYIIALIVRCILNRLSDNRLSGFLEKQLISLLWIIINVRSIRFFSPLSSIFAKRFKKMEAKK